MMIHAYNESYLNDAKEHMAGMMEYAIHDCGLDGNWFFRLFLQTDFAGQFEQGNPSVLAGMSGVELARAVLTQAYGTYPAKEPMFSQSRSPEYWAGWALAHYQWYSGRRFQDIYETADFLTVVSMYPLYHEMDISQFIEAMEERQKDKQTDTKLKRIRESRALSQSELAQVSGVNLRSIQMYEQRINSIDKAQGRTLFKLSRTLGCTVEDLLEEPFS